MKKIIVIFSILITSISYSQNKQKNNVQIINVVYSYETLKGLFKNDVELLINKNTAQFFVNIKGGEKKEYVVGQVEQLPNYHITDYNLTTNTFNEQSKRRNKLFTAEWKNDFVWKITNETKEIGGYKVIKATTDTYEIKKGDDFYYGKASAWFTPDIPISAGPGRYAGLPGLILEIEYEKGGSKYKFKSIDFNSNKQFKNIEEGTKVSKEKILYQ
jgi:hypothetical protein